MKKITALFISATIGFSALSCVFAQAAEQNVKTTIDYSLVVNGTNIALNAGDAVNINGSTFFPESKLVSDFSEAGLTDISIPSEAVDLSGQSYYSIRNVASTNSLRIFWDNTSRTIIVADPVTHDKILDLMNASTEASKDLKKLEMTVAGDVSASIEASGEAPMDFNMSLNGDMKLDLNAPYMEMNFTFDMLGQTNTIHAYDDGQKTYVNSGAGWIASDSSFSQSLALIEQLNSLNSISAQAPITSDSLTYAGLKLAYSGDNRILEGNIFTSELMNEGGLKDMLDAVYESLGMNVSFDFPDTMYVKYVMLDDGTIVSVSTDYDIRAVINTPQEGTAKINVSASINMPKYVINGDFESVIPQEVIDGAAVYEIAPLQSEEPLNDSVDVTAPAE